MLIDIAAAAQVETLLTGVLTGLFRFLGSTTQTAEDIAYTVQEMVQLFIAEHGRTFSVSALLHCVQMIKGGRVPFDAEMYGIQPRKIMRMFTTYKKWLAGKVQAIEKQLQRAQIERSKKEGKPMPNHIKTAFAELREKLENKKPKTNHIPVKNAQMRTVRLLERVELWVVQNIAKGQQYQYFETLKNNWVQQYSTACAGVKVISESDFFELKAEEFLKLKRLKV